MPASITIPSAELALLCDVITHVARAHRLPPDDADDFVQAAHRQLLERNYAPIEKFSGRSPLRIHLTAVVTRLLLDWRERRDVASRPPQPARREGIYRLIDLFRRAVHVDDGRFGSTSLAQEQPFRR